MSENQTPQPENQTPSPEFTLASLTQEVDAYLINNANAFVTTDQDGSTRRVAPATYSGKIGMKFLASTTNLDGHTEYSFFDGYNFEDGHTTEYTWSNDPAQFAGTKRRIGPNSEETQAQPSDIHDVLKLTDNFEEPVAHARRRLGRMSLGAVRAAFGSRTRKQ